MSHMVTVSDVSIIDNAHLLSPLLIFGNDKKPGMLIFKQYLEIITDSDLHLVYHFLISDIEGSISENCTHLFETVGEFFEDICISLNILRSLLHVSSTQVKDKNLDLASLMNSAHDRAVMQVLSGLYQSLNNTSCRSPKTLAILFSSEVSLSVK